MNAVKFITQSIPDILLIEPVIYSDEAISAYKIDAYYSAEHEEGITYDDKDIGIDWHFLKEELILSKVDQNHMNLGENKKLF